MNDVHHAPLDLDLNLVKVFEVIYREQNLTRASEALFLTPSAVSHALRRLRVHFEDPLFEREGGKMRPTPTCRRIAPDLLETLARLRRILQLTSSFAPASCAQTFRIGVLDTAEPMLVPPLCRALRAQAPRARIAGVRFDRSDLERDLGSGRLELVVDVARPVEASLRHRPINRQELCVLMRKNHPFAKRLTQKRYLSGEHVVVSARPSGSGLVDVELRKMGHARDIRMRCQNHYAAAAVVSECDYLLTLP